MLTAHRELVTAENCKWEDAFYKGQEVAIVDDAGQKALQCASSEMSCQYALVRLSAS